MNLKTAKRLRKVAREQTVGSPDRAYQQNTLTKVISLDIRSTRGCYRVLKAAQKLAFGG